MSVSLLPALLGLGTGLALIIAIGAQNAFVLRLGIDGQARVVAPVVLLCALSDAVLIGAGVLGIGALVHRLPVALTVIRIVGAAFLIGYGLMAARRAARPAAMAPSEAGVRGGRAATLLSAAAFTWLNPHVYLDTVLFLGSVANQQGHAERWWWAAGAISASFLWFFGLGFGARLLRPLFARPRSWQVLDVLIAAVMLALGARMVLGV